MSESPASLEGEFTIVNALGLHARAAAQFVKLANRFDSEVFIVKERQEVNGKSIMGVLMLAAAQGTSITLRIEGADANAALAALGALIRDGFGEGK